MVDLMLGHEPALRDLADPQMQACLIIAKNLEAAEALDR
jgi:hypothetical protein